MAPTAIAIAVASMTPACAVAAARNSDAPPPPAASMGTPFTLAQLEVTEGKLVEPTTGHFEVTEAKMRAVAAVPAGDAVDMHFTYKGPTEKSVALDSGEMRRQIGLKLRAQDGCNLIYVMWHIDPTPSVVVAVKSNPGQSTYEECGDRGYTTIKADWSSKAPSVLTGESRTLSASIENDRLLVRIDGNPVWEGELNADARAMNGTMGVRSDNAKFSFDLVPGDTVKPVVWGTGPKS